MNTLKLTYSRFFERYSTFALWLCVGLAVLTLALLPLSYSYLSIKIPINLLYAALVIFLLFFWRDVKSIKALRLPLSFMAIVVIMAYISLFFAVNVSETKHLIRQFLLEPSLFMIMSFLLTMRLKEAQLQIVWFLLCCAFFYHPLATMYDFYANGGGSLGYRAMLPHYHIPPTAYVFYLLFAFSFAYVSFLKTRGLIKCIFGIFTLLGIYAFICNGGRFGALALITMMCAPFVFFTYKRKKIALLGLFLTLCLGGFALYHFSSSWQDRFNFHKIANNFMQVWHTPPSEMGQFAGESCQTWVKCSPHSLNKHSDITMEYSSLERISLLKSTLLAIADNPLRPNGYFFWQFPYNIQQIFPLDSLNHPFSLRDYGDTFISNNAHNHNYPSSIFFELGLVGFVGFSLFVGYFFYAFYKANIDFSSSAFMDTMGVNVRHIFIGSIGLALLGLIVANFFDCFPVREGQIFLFVLLGVFLGAKWHTKNNQKAR
ncbi:O-antigen ligase family protein [Helicobacter sp. MIT 21-1697]|uniref:O-antigen ligase family protein n=1 Tax=Helicobacter sp. MIT 21-1697 TaxID=2993733 RepID=UPI00224B37B9|nr:O-antigen ligase family protein [Helicobacter sp. MIT 21-1697]MCX2717304.1 O-antigen ligase family protein [Helicobacter sp. MIT 21-1697]